MLCCAVYARWLQQPRDNAEGAAQMYGSHELPANSIMLYDYAAFPLQCCAVPTLVLSPHICGPSFTPKHPSLTNPASCSAVHYPLHTEHPISTLRTVFGDAVDLSDPDMCHYNTPSLYQRSNENASKDELWYKFRFCVDLKRILTRSGNEPLLYLECFQEEKLKPVA